MKNAAGYPQMVLRLALGLGFILPVMDRLGWLGAPGSPGVAWGSWTNFVGYTNTLMPFLPGEIASVPAFFATLAEAIFGICLVIGWQTRRAAFGSAILTLLFAICMTIFLGPGAAFQYPVFVFVGAGFLLSCQQQFNWSVDQLLTDKR